MTVRLHLQIVGALLLSLGISHAFHSPYFGWGRELAALPLLPRRVFHVHSFFVALAVGLLGICSLFYTDALVEPTQLSRLLLAGVVIFWSCRLLVKWFVYDTAIWRGRTFYTVMHVVFSLLWIYVIVAYTRPCARYGGPDL